MQFNGIGTDHVEHSRDMHHVTACMHDHTHYKLEGDLPGAAASMAKQQAMQTAQGGQEEPFSLSAWLEKTLGKGRSLFKGIWGVGETPGTGVPGEKTGEAALLSQLGEDAGGRSAGSVAGTAAQVQAASRHNIHTPQIAAAATGAKSLQEAQGNPWFQTLQDGEGRSKSILQKMRTKYKELTGQLTGHLPGRFSGAGKRGNFQAGKEEPKEDLRRHSKYRRDELEIDCILTDDSYLLDSYDRKGSYSRLTTRK